MTDVDVVKRLDAFERAIEKLTAKIDGVETAFAAKAESLLTGYKYELSSLENAFARSRASARRKKT